MDVGLFLIHFTVGALVAAHGAQKLFGWFGGHGLDGTGGFMESLGLRPGRRLAAAAGASELAGGLLLAAGFLTPLAAALIAATMLVAARTAHAGKGPWNPAGGWEYVLVLAVVALGLATGGAGAWSLDAAIGWDIAGFWWGAGAALAALIGASGTLAIARRRPVMRARPV
jgi:putative oxidoreductase